jgi:hypothetical protein
MDEGHASAARLLALLERIASSIDAQPGIAPGLEREGWGEFLVSLANRLDQRAELASERAELERRWTQLALEFEQLEHRARGAR